MNKNIHFNKNVTFIPYYEFGKQRRYDSTYFFDDYYLNLDLNLIEIFAGISKYNYYIKCLRNTQFSKIINNWINNKKFDNIFYFDGKLEKVLKKSWKVIIDYPSSAIMEVEKHKIKSVVLCYSELKIRKTAQDSLSHVRIKKFNTLTECIQIVKSFLLDSK